MKKYLLPALALLALQAAAVPVHPGLFHITLADGTEAEVTLTGDENSLRATLPDGRQLQRGADGLWHPASAMSAKAPARMAALDDEGRTTFPSAGTVRGLAVLLEYADTPFTIPEPQQTISRMLNEEGFSDYGACGSARDYYLASSHGLFDVTFDVTRPVRLEHSRAWYAGYEDDPSGNSINRNFGYAIHEALTRLDAEGFDFSPYDGDNDGVIDNVFFYYAGHGYADTLDPTCIWPHQGDYNTTTPVLTARLPQLTLSGKRMATYACSCELKGRLPQGAQQPWLDGVGVFCHEFGHVLGLPDLYDVNYGGTPSPGMYSVMDSGPYNMDSTCPPLMSAYEQWLCGWLEYTDAEQGQGYNLAALAPDSARALRLRLPKSSGNGWFAECFVIESRSNASGWDRSLPEEGLFIWQINYNDTQWAANNVNTGGKSRVRLLDSAPGLHAWPGESGVTFNCPGTANALEPWSKVRNHEIWLTSMAYDPDTCTGHVDYNTVTEAPEAVTGWLTPTLDANGGVTLAWQPWPGADAYQLTVRYTDPQGKTRYWDGLNNTIIGNRTSFVLGPMTAEEMECRFEASVRVVAAVPALEGSEWLAFTPSQLEASVDTAIAPSACTASKIAVNGPLHAPAGSLVLLPDGRPVATVPADGLLDNLAPGFYIIVAP